MSQCNEVQGRPKTNLETPVRLHVLCFIPGRQLFFPLAARNRQNTDQRVYQPQLTCCTSSQTPEKNYRAASSRRPPGLSGQFNERAVIVPSILLFLLLVVLHLSRSLLRPTNRAICRRRLLSSVFASPPLLPSSWRGENNSWGGWSARRAPLCEAQQD